MIRSIVSSFRRGECSACIVLLVTLSVSALYWMIEPFVNPLLMNDLIDGPLIAVSFSAGFYYLTWSLFNCRRMVDRAWMLRFGICLAWIGNGIWRVTRVLYAQGVLPGPVGAHDPVRGYMILVMVMAGVLHILAIDFNGGRPTKSKTIVAIASVVLGVFGIIALRQL